MSKRVRKHADEVLAELTGRPKADFSAEGYEIPDPEDLERVPVDCDER